MPVMHVPGCLPALLQLIEPERIEGNLDAGELCSGWSLNLLAVKSWAIALFHTCDFV